MRTYCYYRAWMVSQQGFELTKRITMKRKCTGGAQVALEDEQCQDASPFWLVNRFACNSCLACSTRHPPFHPVLQQAVMNVCKHAHNTYIRFLEPLRTIIRYTDTAETPKVLSLLSIKSTVKD